MSPSILFLKAQTPGAASGDLFDQVVQVKGHATKTGAYVAPHTAHRKKHGDKPPAAAKPPAQAERLPSNGWNMLLDSIDRTAPGVDAEAVAKFLLKHKILKPDSTGRFLPKSGGYLEEIPLRNAHRMAAEEAAKGAAPSDKPAKPAPMAPVAVKKETAAEMRQAPVPINNAEAKKAATLRFYKRMAEINPDAHSALAGNFYLDNGHAEFDGKEIVLKPHVPADRAAVARAADWGAAAAHRHNEAMEARGAERAARDKAKYTKALETRHQQYYDVLHQARPPIGAPMDLHPTAAAELEKAGVLRRVKVNTQGIAGDRYYLVVNYSGEGPAKLAREFARKLTPKA